MLKKTNKYQTLLAVCLLTLSACSTNETLTDSPIDQSKTPIELTVGIVGENTATPRAQTRTITNDNPYGQAATAFTEATNLFMVMKSEHATDGTKAAKYTRSIGSVTGSTEAYNAVSFGTGYQRYWEDSYSRDSKVSVYSACVPGKNTALTIGGSDSYNQNNYTWSTEAISPTIVWPMLSVSSPATQDESFLANQDLCFSNNVSDDNRIDFNSSNNQFNPRRMYFHHALTKVTFKIKRGDGFTGANFAFTESGKNIVLTGFNTSGTLDISTGVFSSINTAAINALSLTDHRSEASPAFEYELTCLMLPGSTLNGSDKDALDKIYFTIDENKYHITKSQLATALVNETTALVNAMLSDGSTPALDDYKMRPGVHYIFTMTVSKSQISNLSAAVVGWETVTADEVAPSNARISVTLLENGDKQTGNATFDLFRSANTNTGTTIDDDWTSYAWATGYIDNKAILVYDSNSQTYTATSDGNTPWYWLDNRTFYHFRTLKPKTDDTWKVKLDETDANNNFEYIELMGAPYSTTVANSYRDVCWGAPFNDATTITYDPSTNGFNGTTTYQISKAIGPTTATINMNTFHMMSDVTIKLTTTDGTDAVTLSGATVKLTPVYNTGTVKMGNGLITPGGSTTINGTVSQVGSTNTYQWRYGFVPQSLASVVLTITTTDNNQYIINMEDMVAAVNSTIIANPYTETSSGSHKYTINYWYPNFNYTYNFKLKKTGIEAVTATLTEWGAIVADEETVVIQ